MRISYLKLFFAVLTLSSILLGIVLYYLVNFFPNSERDYIVGKETEKFRLSHIARIREDQKQEFSKEKADEIINAELEEQAKQQTICLFFDVAVEEGNKNLVKYLLENSKYARRYVSGECFNTWRVRSEVQDKVERQKVISDLIIQYSLFIQQNVRHKATSIQQLIHRSLGSRTENIIIIEEVIEENRKKDFQFAQKSYQELKGSNIPMSNISVDIGPKNDECVTTKLRFLLLLKQGIENTYKIKIPKPLWENRILPQGIVQPAEHYYFSYTLNHENVEKMYKALHQKEIRFRSEENLI